MKTKIFRASKRTLSVFLAILMIVSTMLVGVVSVNAATKTIYLKPSDNWKEANAWFAAYVWNDSGSEKWYKLTDTDEDGYYSANIDTSTYPKVIFLRKNPSNTGLDWSGEWNRCETQFDTNGNNCLYVNGWDSYSWGKYTPVTLSKWHVTGEQSGNGNISWDINKLVINGATGSTTLTTNGNTNQIKFKLVAEKSDGSKYLCTTKKTSNETLTKGIKSAALDWCAAPPNDVNNVYTKWTNFDNAINSSKSDVELVYTPSSSAASVTFSVSSDGNYNYVTVTENVSETKTWYLSGNLTKDGIKYSGVSYADDKFKMTQSSTDPSKYTLTYSATGIQYATVNDGTTPYHPANDGASSGTVYDPSQSSVSPASEPSWHTTTLAAGTQITFTWDTSNYSLSWEPNNSGDSGEDEEVGEPSDWYLIGDPAGSHETSNKSHPLYKLSNGLCYIKVTFNGTSYFEFHKNGTWYGVPNNGSNYPVTNDGTQYSIQNGSGGSFKYSGTAGTVKIWLNPSTLKFWIENTTDTPITSGNWYLSGYIAIQGEDFDDIGFADNDFQMTQSTSDENIYTITYTANGSHKQYPTVNDGVNAYHPATNGADSGDPATVKNTSPTSNNKWCADIADGTKVTFTWDASTKVLSWATAKTLAESVKLSASTNSVKVDKSFTLTATLLNPAEENLYVTYTLYDAVTNTQIGDAVSNNNGVATFNIDSSYTASAKTLKYKVVVTTNEQYKENESDSEAITYAAITSNTVNVEVTEGALYISTNITTDSSTGYLKAPDNGWNVIGKDVEIYKTGTITLTSDSKYVFAFSDVAGYSTDFFDGYTVDTSKCNYCKIVKGSGEIDDNNSVNIFTLTCYENCTNPTLYVDTENRTVYAVANFDMNSSTNSSNTESLDKKVTYYFAERTGDDENDSNPSDNTAGLRIKCWNNSSSESELVDVKTAVYRYNDKGEKYSGENTIYVDGSELFNNGDMNGTDVEFKIYSAELPVWATSFAFTSQSGFVINTSSATTGQAEYASLVLNPNRVYCYYSISNGNNYAKGIVLDDALWDKDATNQVNTKDFAANAVKYATYDKGNKYIGSGAIEGNYNGTTLLNAYNNYSTSYKHPLFFGYIGIVGEDWGNYNAFGSNFKLWDNLAFRKDSNSYYAAVQGLVGNKLNSENKLLGYDNAKVMPLFDYDNMKDNGVATSVYTNTTFPFNESDFNGIKTYSYDSTTDYNRRIDNNGKYYVANSEYIQSGMGDNYLGFFPYGPEKKYGFGTEFSVDFYLTESGYLIDNTGKKHDIAFNFSGDDDVWVFIDGVLVLDLGGAHKISAGSINFSDMQVYYKSATKHTDKVSDSVWDTFATDTDYIKSVSLKNIFDANGITFNNKDGAKMHTLQMFYMERGSFDSNCSVSFNLPQNSGLRVVNDIDIDSVNPAFVTDTLKVANDDYFSYQIRNGGINDTDYNTINAWVNTVFSNLASDFNLARTVEYNQNTLESFNLEYPLYPVENSGQINRVLDDETTIKLASANSSTTGSPSNNYLPSPFNTSFIDVSQVNYHLLDFYSKTTSTVSDPKTDIVGRTSADGKFNLLYSQTASFENKIVPHTLIKVSQFDELYSVNTDGSVIAQGGVNGRTVSDYYSTSYTIKDTNSNLVVGSKEYDSNDNATIMADDTSDISNAFYFTNYADPTSESTSMIVNYKNTVATGDIVIKKSLESGLESNVNFRFKVEFANIFGSGSDSYSEYNDGTLEYSIYNSADDSFVGTKYYKNGVLIKAGQYAVISGVPVQTKYKITELATAGYKFNSASYSTTRFTPLSGFAIQSEINADNTSYSSGYIPVVTDTTNYSVSTPSSAEFSYVNTAQGFIVKFSYYDREVTSGTPAHIDTNATSFNYVFDDAFGEFATPNVDSEGYTVTAEDLDEIVGHAYTNSNAKDIGNVVDDYSFWSNQGKALKGIKNEVYLKHKYRDDGDKTVYSDDESRYSELFSDAELAYHTDAFGTPVTSTDSHDKWVSFYDSYGNEITDPSKYSEIASIEVWLFNTLKKYTLTTYIATNITEVNDSPISDNVKASAGVTGNVYVATNQAKTFTTFYNIRLGEENDGDAINGAGSYLKDYGIDIGYTGSYSGTATSLDDSENYEFLYWSDRSDGSTIVSTEHRYGYRITKTMTLYAVYGNPEMIKSTPGLYVTENQRDSYVVSSGSSTVDRTRLNTMMNTYNTYTSDPRISQVAIVYVMAPNYTDAELSSAQLSALRSEVGEILVGKSAGSVSGKIDNTNATSVGTRGNGFVYDVLPYDPEASYGSYEVYLTNKNRLQFSTNFADTSLAKYKRMFAFAAMNYDGTWIVSDNCIDYKFY